MRGTTNKTQWKRGLAALTALVCLCCLLPAAALAEEAPQKIGGLTLSQKREARVFLGTLDSVYTLTTWLFEEQPDVPYVSLKEYVSLLYVDTYNPVCGFGWEGDTLLVTHNDASVAVDTAKQTVSCEDWTLFAGPNAAGALADGIVEKVEFIAMRPSVKNVSEQTQAQGFTVSLADYGVEMIRTDEDVLAPFAIAQVLFGAPSMRGCLAYNGDDYYDIVNSVKSIYGSAQLEYAPNPYANMWYSGSFAQRKELSEAYAKYNYAAMCLLLDLTFGHKEEKGITSFDAYITEQGLKDALLTTDPKDDREALKTLFGVLFDSGHDAELLSRTIIDSEGAIATADLVHRLLGLIGMETLADLNNALQPLFLLLMKMLPRQDQDTPLESDEYGPNLVRLLAANMRMSILKPFGYGAQRVDISGDTCVIYFDGFQEDLTRSESYYTKLPTKDDMKSSSFGLFYYAFQKIKENGNIKNVVFDLTANGGGSAAALIATLGFLSPDGEVKITYRDLLNRNYRTEYYHVDTNLDGRFDDEDGYGGQYDFYILTTGMSYSCGTAFPYFAQQMGLAKIVGEQPGGGDCVLAPFVDAYGHVGGISGFKQLGVMGEDGVFVSDETAVTVDYPLTEEEGDAIYFHADKIAAYIDGLSQ